MLPSGLTPSLGQVSTYSGFHKYVSTSADVKVSCAANVNPPLLIHPKACFYGDEASNKTVILYGDSNAANWAPALDIAFKALKLRLAVLVMPGCDVGFMMYTSSQNPHPQQCEEWHSNLGPVAKSLRPVAVLLSSSGWLYPSPSGWFPAINKAFETLTGGNSQVQRILIGTSPPLPFRVPECLASYPSHVQSCTLSYTDPTSKYAGILSARQGDRLIHGRNPPARRQVVVRARPLPADRRRHDGYLDNSHLSTVYGKYLAGVFQSALTTERIRNGHPWSHI